MKIKIYGERNTGTNFLEDLIRLNFDCEVVKSNLPGPIKSLLKGLRERKSLHLDFLDEPIKDFFHTWVYARRYGWKHKLLEPSAGATIHEAGLRYLLTNRDPYAWLHSMYKRPHNLGVNTRDMSFAEFLSTPCHTVRREGVPFRKYSNPVEIWTIKSQAMQKFFDERSCQIITHEQMVLNPEEALAKFAQQTNLPMNDKLQVPQSSTKKDGRTKADIERVILDREWLAHYRTTDLAFVNQYLDVDTMSYFGYELSS